eukprot:TRINITY_DN38546_c0_g1_i1.p1 TRINITY_DN38546_c0_g1~~TRINITY_DN38546_c0_g1_i1.p1  ORF type:complete len:692 (+),score=75.20 TRINITY_DN38546_c0_g1_i1:128-2203(+)
MSAGSHRPGIEAARVLVTGATGLLGRQVFRVLAERGWVTRGLGRSRAKGNIVCCDLFNLAEVEAQFKEFRPTIVIHCAAERRPDVVEADRTHAMKLNVDLTREIAKLCCAEGSWLIYMSTNYVFDGKDAPYAEDAQANPINTYGQSKYEGERTVAEIHPDAAILRVPLLYGPIEYLDETSVTSLLSALRKGAALEFCNWQERFPTSSEDVAMVLEAVCGSYVAKSREQPEAFRGVFHWQASERHTKYTMAMVIAMLASIDTSRLVPVNDAPAPGLAPRPQFERMLCGRLHDLLLMSGERDPERFRSDFRRNLRLYLEPFVGPDKTLPHSLIGSMVVATIQSGQPACDSKRNGVEGVRVLVTGATGLLGRQMISVFEHRGWSVRGLGFSRATGAVLRCNLMSPKDLAAQFADFRPTIVVHCAAERRPDKIQEDTEYATKMNVECTRQVGRLCKERGSWLVYVSTNYVFDGESLSYAEDAIPRPVNTYGKSKLAGEVALRDMDVDFATLRIPLLYGPVEHLDESSVTALLSAMRQDSCLKLDNWQERFPTSACDVARVVEALSAARVLHCAERPESFRGIFHWQANERHTKYTMGIEIAKLAGIDSCGLVGVDDPPPPGAAPRPHYERMMCGRLERELASFGENLHSFRCDFRSELARGLEPFLCQVKRRKLEAPALCPLPRLLSQRCLPCLS